MSAGNPGKEQRGGFAALARRRLVLPLAIFIADLALYALCISLAVTATQAPAKFALAILAGVFVSLLAIVGHDAVHKSFTSVPWLNRLIGTIAFLPALHPYSRWEHHHNRVHHRYTAQLGLDNAYPPMTVEDYARASAREKFLYRCRRSFAGQFTYYLLDLWLPKIFLPGRTERAGFHKRDWTDLVLVHAWLPVFVAGLTVSLHLATGRAWLAAFADAALFGFLVPFLVWNVFISMVTIVQHTGPDVRWIMPTGRPSTAAEKMGGTVHVVFPNPVDWLFHRVMQHPAHHIHSGIPLYTLRQAESDLASLLPDQPTIAKWTPLYHWRLTRECKLYDVKRRAWCDFSSQPVTALNVQPIAAQVSQS
ncbi:MAG TPA: fatty acid desaturase [Rhizomicrobium sp.]